MKSYSSFELCDIDFFVLPCLTVCLRLKSYSHHGFTS